MNRVVLLSRDLDRRERVRVVSVYEDNCSVENRMLEFEYTPIDPASGCSSVAAGGRESHTGGCFETEGVDRYVHQNIDREFGNHNSLGIATEAFRAQHIQTRTRLPSTRNADGPTHQMFFGARSEQARGQERVRKGTGQRVCYISDRVPKQGKPPRILALSSSVAMRW